MSEELKDQLLTYYGELMYLRDRENDYFGKIQYYRKMEAVDVLLGLSV